jgi:hypothetical protein
MKWYGYLICIVCVLVGVWSGITLWQKVHAESYINGSIDITNDLYTESFTYDNSLFDDVIAFSHDIYDETDTYAWQSENLPTVTDFNGVTKTYRIEVNGYRIFNATISAGGVLVRTYIDFYDTENNLLVDAYYDLSIRFLSNKTEVEVKTTSQQNANFIEQYFTDNGLRISIKEVL